MPKKEKLVHGISQGLVQFMFIVNIHVKQRGDILKALLALTET